MTNELLAEDLFTPLLPYVVEINYPRKSMDFVLPPNFNFKPSEAEKYLTGLDYDIWDCLRPNRFTGTFRDEKIFNYFADKIKSEFYHNGIENVNPGICIIFRQ